MLLKTNFLEAIYYFRLSIGTIVLFEVFALAGSQNPTNFSTERSNPYPLYTIFLEKGSPFV